MSLVLSMEVQTPRMDVGNFSTHIMDYSTGEVSNRIRGIASRAIHNGFRMDTIRDQNVEVSRADARLSAAQQNVTSTEEALSSEEQILEQAHAREQMATEEVERVTGVVEEEDNNLEPLRHVVIDAEVEHFVCSVLESAAHRDKEQAETVAIEAQRAFEDEFERSED